MLRYIEAVIMSLFGLTIVIANVLTANQLLFYVIGCLMLLCAVFMWLEQFLKDKK